MIVKGYRGEISAEESQNLAARGIYVFNSLCIGCREHVEWAHEKATKSFENKKNIAKKKHLELMLILSGKRQISEALKFCGSIGVKSVVAISEKDFELPLQRDDKVLEFSEEKLRHLGIYPVKGKKCELFFENSSLLELER